MGVARKAIIATALEGGNGHPTPAPSSGRYRCRDIGSWPKAQELLNQGHHYLDRDGDGEACENLK